ncbi:MAG: aspartate carbamoyltransferase catalytic subunit [Acidobacteria bacterium]|nr:aspartate carbamoyltransferase catalytic subunit [Acidobacteriota bacterium]
MKHLLALGDLDRDELSDLVSLVATFEEISQRSIPKVPALRGRTVAMLFYENSTRTRLSFETAAKRLSADTMNFSVGASSVSKGESLRDTVHTIDALGADAIVVRHASAGVPKQLTRWTDVSIINAGDGWHAHPTQALLDIYSMQSRLGELEGRRVGIVGDIKHSRVARSNVAALSTLGAEVVLVAPPTLLPPAVERWPVTISHDLDAVIDSFDVVYLLRMQSERQQANVVPSLREYRHDYGLTAQRAERLRDEVLVMHPGPMNRGVEIDDGPASAANDLITAQVTNGVAARMAVLFMMLGSGSEMVAEVAVS